MLIASIVLILLILFFHVARVDGIARVDCAVGRDGHANLVLILLSC